MAQIQTKFIANLAVTNAKLAQMAANSLKGNNTGSSAAALDLTVAQVQTMLSIPTSSSPLSLAAGGTGISAGSANAAFNALSPMTTLGDTIYGGASGVATRLAVGTTGQVLTIAGGIPSWATPSAGGITTIGTINSQTAQANGLDIVGTTLYAQYATTSNPGMVSIATAGAITATAGAISVATDGSTIKINGTDQLESIQPNEEQITLSPTDITNQYVDLAHPIFGSSASANSAQVFIVGGPTQQKTVDYTVSLTGGSGGVTRLTFAGDLATGGNAALVSGDIFVADYSYLA